MRRREFITLVGGAAAASWPLVARAQQSAMPIVGVLSSASANSFVDRLRAFRQGMAETGYIEGRTVVLDFRWADDRYERLPALAADLVRRNVSLIAALGNQQPALAAKAATSSIPIVFSMGADPLQNGLVASLSRPGGNITGITQLAGALASKRMQLLHELVPKARVIGALGNPENAALEATIKEEQDAVGSLGMSTEIVKARTEGDLDAAFASLAQKRVDALDVIPDTLFSSRPELLVGLAARHRLPTIYWSNEFPKAGGLMSYGSDILTSYRQAGIYVSRILKGEKPGDLPVIQASTFQFVINLKTAKTLGLTVPPNLLAIADEVIE
jgi:putative tryptophan/tyrosine transport system substrate-binding protein